MNTETMTCPITWDTRAARSKDGAFRIAGRVAVFDSRSHDLGGFREVLKRGAFKRVLSDAQTDVVLNVDHAGMPIARMSAGSLRLSEDGSGLKIEAELAPTSTAADVFALVQSNHLRDMSFAFVCGKDEWGREEGMALRTVLDVSSLHDVSIVTRPAYASTSVAARSGVRVAGERSQYGPDSENSYFRDLLVVAEAAQRRQASRLDPLLRGDDPGPSGVPGVRGREDVQAARMRLASVESRALSVAADGPLAPQNVPTELADLFATAARAAGVLPGLLGTQPLPADSGMSVKIPRLKSGASVAVDATENAALSDTDPVAAQVESPIVYISGQVELSRQVLDRARPDDFLAQELGAALGAAVDTQILNGTGEKGETIGLLNVTGATSTTWTALTPTGAELISRVGENYGAVARALGRRPDALLVSPTRAAWIYAQADSSKRPLTPRLLAALNEVPGMPATLGIGLNQEAILQVASGEAHLFMEPPRVTVVSDYTGSSNLMAKFTATVSLALIVPQPAAVGVISGTGLIAPPTFA